MVQMCYVQDQAEAESLWKKAAAQGEENAIRKISSTCT